MKMIISKQEKYEILAKLKDYINKIEKSDASQLNQLISAIKGYIYGQEILKNEYEAKMETLKYLMQSEGYKKKIKKFYGVLTRTISQINDNISFWDEPESLFYISFLNHCFPFVENKVQKNFSYISYSGILKFYVDIATNYLKELSAGKKYIDKVEKSLELLPENLCGLADFYMMDLDDRTDIVPIFPENITLFKVAYTKILHIFKHSVANTPVEIEPNMKEVIEEQEANQKIRSAYEKDSKAKRIMEIFQNNNGLTYKQIAERVSTTENYVKKVMSNSQKSNLR